MREGVKSLYDNSSELGTDLLSIPFRSSKMLSKLACHLSAGSILL
jgi:hypothetical protein